MSAEENRRKAERIRSLYIARKVRTAQNAKPQATAAPSEAPRRAFQTFPYYKQKTGKALFAGQVKMPRWRRFRYYTVAALVLFGIFITIANVIEWIGRLFGFGS